MKITKKVKERIHDAVDDYYTTHDGVIDAYKLVEAVIEKVIKVSQNEQSNS